MIKVLGKDKFVLGNGIGVVVPAKTVLGRFVEEEFISYGAASVCWTDTSVDCWAVSIGEEIVSCITRPATGKYLVELNEDVSNDLFILADNDRQQTTTYKYNITIDFSETGTTLPANQFYVYTSNATTYSYVNINFSLKFFRRAV